MSKMLDFVYRHIKELRERGLEYTSGRYYAKYQGEASTVVDPQEQGRVRVTTQYVTGRTAELRQWAYPSTPYGGKDKGFYFPPDEGDPVWVWFDLGKPDQPRISGSWFCNPDQARKPATSDVPAEFRGDGTTAPTRRGIKWKRGHLLLGEDDPSAAKIILQTGEQTEPGVEAETHHKVLLDDTPGAEQIVISSFGGHKMSWVDIAGQEKVEIQSAAEHIVRIDDANENITLRMKGGYEIVIDQQGKTITAQTPGQQSVTLDDNDNSITVQDVTQSSIKLEPTGITIDTPKLIEIKAAATVNVEAGGAATVKAGGAATVEAGAGLILSGQTIQASSTSAGTASMTAQGLKSDTFNGGWTTQVTGLWDLVATTIRLIGTAIEIGGAGTKFALIDERFLINYAAHTHQYFNGPLPLQTAVPTQPVVPATVTTQTLRAN